MSSRPGHSQSLFARLAPPLSRSLAAISIGQVAERLLDIDHVLTGTFFRGRVTLTRDERVVSLLAIGAWTVARCSGARTAVVVLGSRVLPCTFGSSVVVAIGAPSRTPAALLSTFRIGLLPRPGICCVQVARCARRLPLRTFKSEGLFSRIGSVKGLLHGGPKKCSRRRKHSNVHSRTQCVHRRPRLSVPRMGPRTQSTASPQAFASSSLSRRHAACSSTPGRILNSLQVQRNPHV
jgi:hypothetical protein